MVVVVMVVGMCACNRVMTCMQVCETGPLHLSSLTMNSLQRGQLHHRWTWANCLNAGKYTGKHPPPPPPLPLPLPLPTPARIHTQSPTSPLLPPSPSPSACLTKENFPTEGAFLLQPDHNRPRWTAASSQNKASGDRGGTIQWAGLLFRMKKKVVLT